MQRFRHRFAALLLIWGGLLLLQQSVQALGLQPIEVLSSINQPLKAHIQLVATGELLPDQIQVKLASVTAFDELQVPRSPILTQLRFSVEPSSVGAASGLAIEITTAAPIKQPVLTFLVDVSWPAGELVRQYVVLLSPADFVHKTVAGQSPALAQSAPLVGAAFEVGESGQVLPGARAKIAHLATPVSHSEPKKSHRAGSPKAPATKHHARHHRHHAHHQPHHRTHHRTHHHSSKGKRVQLAWQQPDPIAFSAPLMEAPKKTASKHVILPKGSVEHDAARLKATKAELAIAAAAEQQAEQNNALLLEKLTELEKQNALLNTFVVQQQEQIKLLQASLAAKPKVIGTISSVGSATDETLVAPNAATAEDANQQAMDQTMPADVTVLPQATQTAQTTLTNVTGRLWQDLALLIGGLLAGFLVLVGGGVGAWRWYSRYQAKKQPPQPAALNGGLASRVDEVAKTPAAPLVPAAPVTVAPEKRTAALAVDTDTVTPTSASHAPPAEPTIDPIAPPKVPTASNAAPVAVVKPTAAAIQADDDAAHIVEFTPRGDAKPAAPKADAKPATPPSVLVSTPADSEPELLSDTADLEASAAPIKLGDLVVSLAQAEQLIAQGNTVQAIAMLQILIVQGKGEQQRGAEKLLASIS